MIKTTTTWLPKTVFLRNSLTWCFVFGIIMTHSMAPDKYEELLKFGPNQYKSRYGNKEMRMTKRRNHNDKHNYTFSVSDRLRASRVTPQQPYASLSYSRGGATFRQVATTLAEN